MNRKLKSLLALSLSAMMLLTACGEKDENDDDGKKSSGKSESAINVDFEFEGINSAISYAENAIGNIEDALKGKVDTGVTTEVSVSFGDAIIDDAGLDIKEFKLANSAKVKEGIVANDMALYYDGNSLISLNTVIDDTTVYFRIPEVSDSYLKGDVSEMESVLTSTNMVENNVANSVYMAANPGMIEGPAGNTDAIVSALESFDDDKLSEIFNEISSIIEENMPKGKAGDKASGEINGIKYDYSSKIYSIGGKNTYDAMVDILNYIKKDKDIANAYDALMADTKQQMLNSGYYTEEEIAEYYPSFENIISDAISSLEAEKEDAYNSDEVVELKVYYDGEEATGISLYADEAELEIVMVDRAEELGLKISADNDEYKEYTNMAFSIEGSDGKYDALFKVVNDYEGDEYDSSAEFGFNSDVTIVDEESGAFKGEIEFFISADNEKMSLVVTSDSSAKNTDISFEVVFDGESLITIGLTSVETNASDVTIPIGKIYDITNESDVEAYSNEADLEGLEAHFKSVLGDELFEEMFGSDYDDDYYYDDYDYDYDYDYSY